MDVLDLFSGLTEQKPSTRQAPLPPAARPDFKPRDYGPIWKPLPMPTHFVTVDMETFPFGPGNQTPKPVCIQFKEWTFKDGAWHGGKEHLYGGLESDLDYGVAFIEKLIRRKDILLVFFNGFFDLAVILNYRGWPKSLFRAILAAMRAGMLRDLLVLAKQHANQEGTLDFDPVLGRPSKFNLEDVTKHYTGQSIEGKHGPDVWRLRYGELYGIPKQDWPQPAIQYACLDVVYPGEAFIAILSQITPSPDEAFQNEKWWWLYLGAVQGIISDPNMVRELELMILPAIEEGIKALIEQGIYRPEVYGVDKKAIAEILVKLLGDSCPKTPGGEVSVSAKSIKRALAKPIDPTEEQILIHYNDLDWLAVNEEEYVKVTKEASKNMAELRRIVFEHYDGNPPMTAGGKGPTKSGRPPAPPQVSTARKVLREIPELRGLVEIGEFFKVKTTYLPIVRKPIVHTRPNGLVASGRVSYTSSNWANWPRLKGVRDCFRAPLVTITLRDDEKEAA